MKVENGNIISDTYNYKLYTKTILESKAKKRIQNFYLIGKVC